MFVRLAGSARRRLTVYCSAADAIFAQKLYKTSPRVKEFSPVGGLWPVSTGSIMPGQSVGVAFACLQTVTHHVARKAANQGDTAYA